MVTDKKRTISEFENREMLSTKYGIPFFSYDTIVM